MSAPRVLQPRSADMKSVASNARAEAAARSQLGLSFVIGDSDLLSRLASQAGVIRSYWPTVPSPCLTARL
jgi:hypothetical protein